MIVKRKDYDTKSVKNTHKEEEIITIAFNIREIENLYAREEKNYVEKIKNTFNENCQGVSLGGKVISDLIELFKDEKKQMSIELFQAMHKQLRSALKLLFFLLHPMLMAT